MSDKKKNSKEKSLSEPRKKELRALDGPNKILADLESRLVKSLDFFTKELQSFRPDILDPDYIGRMQLSSGVRIYTVATVSAEKRMYKVVINSTGEMRSQMVKEIKDVFKNKTNLAVAESAEGKHVLEISVAPVTTESKQKMEKEIRKRLADFHDTNFKKAREASISQLKKYEPSPKKNGNPDAVSEDDFRDLKNFVSTVVSESEEKAHQKAEQQITYVLGKK